MGIKKSEKTEIQRLLDSEPNTPPERVGTYIMVDNPGPPIEKVSAVQQAINELRAERDAKAAEVTKRLEAAIAKEEAIKSLLAAQRQYVAELLSQGEKSGELLGCEEAAKKLNLPTRTLREYATRGIIPSIKFVKRRKFNMHDVREALEKLGKDGQPRNTAAVRKRLLH